MKRAALNTLIALAIAAAKLAAADPVPPATTAPSTPDPMAPFYGNTLTIAVPAGYYYASRFINPDGTWFETRGGTVTARGRWYAKDGQTCHVQTEPSVHEPRHYCYPPTDHKAGDEWVTIDPDTGNEVIQAIEPGRPADLR